MNPKPYREAWIRVAAAFSEFPEVEAVTVAGSLTGIGSDELSDIDMYVYSRKEISLNARTIVAETYGRKGTIEMDNRFWESGDEWVDDVSGIAFDIMYRSPDWIEDQVARSVSRCEASVGYSTCFWHNVLHSDIIFDRYGWFSRLKEESSVPYPSSLQRAVINKNLPLLRERTSSYWHQVTKVIARNDWVSVNHRIAAFLASYFDVLFALNAVPHPGEKRLVQYAHAQCTLLPPDWKRDVEALVILTDDASLIPERLKRMSVELETLCERNGFPLE